jgi:ABC-type amino acid transport substrate-binding protein
MLTIARIMSWAVCLRTGLLANSALAGAARPTRRTASTRPIVILVLCGAFLIARVVSVIALILSNLRHHAIEQSKQQLLATATVLARQAARDFQSIDLIDANLICDLVADAVKARLSLAKLEVKLVPITPSLRVPYILSEKIDLACETMTNNLEQQKVVAFSSTYFIAANRFVSKMAANLKTLDDLKGRTVVSTIGSTNLKQISELNEQRHLGLAIVAAKDNFEAFRMLETDRAAAVVMDDILLTAPWPTRRRPPTTPCRTRRWHPAAARRSRLQEGG